MAESKICEFEVYIVRMATISAKDQNIARFYILMPAILRQLRLSVMCKVLYSPNEDIWTSQTVGPFNGMDAWQSFEKIEESFPKQQYVFTKCRWCDVSEEFVQCEAIGVFEQDVVGVALSVTSQKLDYAFMFSIFARYSLECLNLVVVVAFGIASIVGFENVGVRWSTTLC